MTMRCFSSLILASLLMVACSPMEVKSPPQSTVPPIETTIRTGVLTYVAGDVAIQKGGSWVPIDIGDAVAQDAVVRTGKQSVCDIQFEQFGIVHLSENTTLALKTVGITRQRRTVDLELVVGSVTAKVSKLAGADRFQVTTEAITCGVRGTRFVVTKNDSTKTTVAVAEGFVALIPPTYDPQRLDALRVSTVSEDLVQAAEAKILTGSPSVGVGSEVVVTKASMEKSSLAVTQIQDALASVPEAETGVFSDTVNAAFDAYRQSLPPAEVTAPQPQSPASQKLLAETAALKIREAAPQALLSPAPTVQPSGSKPVVSAKPVTLAKPRAVFPASGQTIDIIKQSSITFSWKAVAGAAGYEVKLYFSTGSSQELVKTWTTAGLSAVLDKFDDFQAGSFVWEVAAVHEDGSGKGPVSTTPFKIIKGSTLPAPSLDLSGNAPSNH